MASQVPFKPGPRRDLRSMPGFTEENVVETDPFRKS